MIRALIFDFDGVILETEMPDYKAWQSVFSGYGIDLPLTLWGGIIGQQMAHAGFDPCDYIEKHSGKSVDRIEVGKQHNAAYMSDVLNQPILPGILDTIEEARSSGLRLAVASSSDRKWVHGHLERLNLIDQFSDIKTADDVKRTKPDPELYLKSLDALALDSREAIVFEDSPNGLRAANSAGIFAVAIPTELTIQLDLSLADMQVDSLASVTLSEIISRAEQRN
jgi:HAD superfamily hydrolase (TIGR01509 family)